MKRILSLFLAIVTLSLCFFASSCRDESQEQTPDDASITIGTDYVITIPQKANDGEEAAAAKLKTALSEFCGLSLVVSDDYFTDPNAIPTREIVIGRCRRPDTAEAKSKASDLGYTVLVKGERIYFYASDDVMLDHAVSYFIKTYVTGKSTVSLKKDLELTYNHEFSQPELKINGVDISQYKIVYGDDVYLKTPRHNGKWVESGRLKDAAVALQEEIYLLTKKKLTVEKSSSKNETDYEIIVGWAGTRAVCNDYFRNNTMDLESYAFGTIGTKVLFAGGSSNASYYAGVAFANACKNMDGNDFTAAMKKGKADLIKVACIGDSITDGAGQMDDGSSNDHNVHSYPVYLQKLLGFKYLVANYGHGGQRMMSYTNESPNFLPSVNYKPDVVIMMFGTNDANKGKYTPDWGTDAAKTRYMAAASYMLEQYKKANENVQLIIMTPPSIIRNATHRTNALLAAQYNREFAQANGLPLVDMWVASEKANWTFNDGIHPQGEIYSEMADVVYAGIKDVIVK